MTGIIPGSALEILETLNAKILPPLESSQMQNSDKQYSPITTTTT